MMIPVAHLDPHVPAMARVFQRRGEYWTIMFGRTFSFLRDSKGLAHLARLLGQPNVPIHAVDFDDPLPAHCGEWRRTGEAAERARVNVTRTIKGAIARIARDNPELGRHLAQTVRTGLSCCYRPDPRDAGSWEGC